MTYIYPSTLVPVLKKAWPKRQKLPGQQRRPLPPEQALTLLLETCYQASFLREEGRSLAYRVVFYPRKDFESAASSMPSRSYERSVLFTKPRPFSVAELHRLAPAAEYVSSLVCVEMDEAGEWSTWGLIDTGSNWWNFIHHESNMGMMPPDRLTISSANAGELIISCQGEILLTLRSGAVDFPSIDLFSNGPISAFLEDARKSLYSAAVAESQSDKWDSTDGDDDYPHRFYNFCLSRILSRIRAKKHGGTVLLVSDKIAFDDSRLTDRVIIKYPSVYDHAWPLMVKSLVLHKQYYDLYFPLWHSKKALSVKRFQKLSMIDTAKTENEEQLADCFRFMASLTGVDGALILTDRLRLLGFGGEIIASSPTLLTVELALDAKAKTKRTVHLENYGTRHRSALRFCSSYEESIAFIVSQDGGVKAGKRCGSNVILWPDVNMGSLGI